MDRNFYTRDPAAVARDLLGKVIVRRLEEKSMSSGAKGAKVHLADTAKEAPQMGVVVAVGPGRVPDGPVEVRRDELGTAPQGNSSVFTLVERRIYAPPVVEVGDKVMFGKFSGFEVPINQEIFFVLRQDEIVAIIEADEAELTDDVGDVSEVGD